MAFWVLLRALVGVYLLQYAQATSDTTLAAATEASSTLASTTEATTSISPSLSQQMQPSPVSRTQLDNCLCDLTGAACDVNCYCDPDCSDADRSAFAAPNIIRENKDNYCVWKETVFLDNSKFETTENSKRDLLCLWRDNYDERNFYTTVDAVSTDNEFQSLMDEFSFDGRFSDSAEEVSLADEVQQVYSFGSPIFVIGSSGEIDKFATLGKGLLSDNCLDNNQIGFLQESQESCVTIMDCDDPKLSISSFIGDFQVVRNTSVFQQVLVNETLELEALYNESSLLIPVQLGCISVLDLSSGILGNCSQNTSGVLSSQLETIDGSDQCSNAVIELAYRFVYSSGSNLESVFLDVVISHVPASETSVTQKISISFTEASEAATTEPVARSGNPGYLRGYPIQKGLLNYDEDSESLSIVSSSGDVFVSIVEPSADSCSGQRVPVGFGMNTASGCSISVTQENFTGQDSCDLLQQLLLNNLLGDIPTQEDGNVPNKVIKGPQFAEERDLPNLYISRFGNVDLEKPGDWIEVFVDEIPAAVYSNKRCFIVSGVQLDILYANVGRLGSPQAKIIGAKYSFKRSEHLFKCDLKCRNSATEQKLFGNIVVNFVDVSKKPQGSVKKIPPIKTDLPANFFYPFLIDSASALKPIVTVAISLILVFLI